MNHTICRHFLKLLILPFLFFTAEGRAQTGVLTGKLTDRKATPVKFANVTVLNQHDSSFVKGVLTDENGKFSMETPVAGAYILRFTAIGFTEMQMVIETNSASKDIGTLTLSEEVKKMSDVTVKTNRPTITQMADRLVVNVQGTAMAAGSTAFDVLARSPGVFVDHDGNIQLNGRAGVTVMIDGKLTYLSARDLRTMLEAMPAENIRNIEIITNPSSKYDAEGSSGILNINLKKNDRNGMNGSVFAGYNYNGKQHGYSTGGTINYKSGKWNSFLTTDLARRVGGREATFTRIFYGTQETIFFDQVATGNFQVQGPPSFRVGTDYSLTDKHSIGGMVNFTTNKSTQDFLTDTWIGGAPGNPNLFIDANNISTNRYKNFTSNLHYSGKLDTNGTIISSDLDYARIRNHSQADFINFYKELPSSQVREDFLYTDIPSGYDIYSAKIDFTHPFSRGRKFEVGGKASRVISDNDSRFYFNNSGLVLDPKRTNHFNYRENIFAAYVNFGGNLSKSISVQGGLRAELTQSKGHQITTGAITNRSYLNLFPTLFIQQKVSDNYGINYSYSRRIQRPNYGSLNPFRFYRDPYTYVEGNPYLRPQYAHSISVTQIFKKTYNLVLSYQRNKDFISELPRLETDSAITIYYTGNVDKAYSMGATAIVPVRISKFWDIQNTLVATYSKFEIEVNKNMLVNEQLYYSLQSYHTIQLPENFRFEVTFTYQGPAAYGLYQIAPRSRVDLALKKSFLNKKLDLSLNAIDLFKGQRLKFKTDINGNINDFDQYLRNRYFGITLRYHFSKGQKVDVKRRNNSLDELNRT